MCVCVCEAKARKKKKKKFLNFTKRRKINEKIENLEQVIFILPSINKLRNQERKIKIKIKENV